MKYKWIFGELLESSEIDDYIEKSVSRGLCPCYIRNRENSGKAIVVNKTCVFHGWIFTSHTGLTLSEVFQEHMRHFSSGI